MHCRVFTIVESLLESSCIHNPIESLVKNIIGDVYYISLVKNVIGGVYYVVDYSVKLSLNQKPWYHMHVEVSRTLHALEICEMCHT